jgi:hypothetical protein
MQVVSGVNICLHYTDRLVTPGGLVVNEIAIGPKIRCFKPSRWRWIYKSKVTIPYRWEVKLSVTCRNILRHVKEPHEYERDTSKTKYISLSSASLLDVSASNFLKVWWTNQEIRWKRTIWNGSCARVPLCAHPIRIEDKEYWNIRYYFLGLYLLEVAKMCLLDSRCQPDISTCKYLRTGKQIFMKFYNDNFLLRIVDTFQF